ncbi:hypothetical protein BH11BAC3_BH11BAC3_20680 [soil metagenome]
MSNNISRIAMNLFIIIFLVTQSCHAQELFSLTEPASNRAAGSIGFRIDNTIMDEQNSSRTNYHLIPEVMIGISKKLTVNGSLFFSNRSNAFRGEGGSIYAKYRFVSNDAVQRHFRMAAYGRISVNNSDIHQEEIDLNGHNTGAEFGLVATKLIQKVAISSTASFVKATDNVNSNKFIYGTTNSKAVNYTLSFGKLMLPTAYSTYRQTNINCMVELLNQVNTGSGKYYMDIAPSVQMIFNSQSRIDVGYRKELASNMIRTAPNGFFIRLEYNFFNVF